MKKSYPQSHSPAKITFVPFIVFFKNSKCGNVFPPCVSQGHFSYRQKVYFLYTIVIYFRNEITS